MVCAWGSWPCGLTGRLVSWLWIGCFTSPIPSLFGFAPLVYWGSRDRVVVAPFSSISAQLQVDQFFDFRLQEK